MNYDAAAVVDKGEWMDCVWLVCILEGGGVWVPRQDLPPAFDEDVARAFALEQTVLSERRHEAKRFSFGRANSRHVRNYFTHRVKTC